MTSARQDDPVPEGRSGDVTASPGGTFGRTILFDVALPVGLYYILRAFGLSELMSLLLSGAPPALHTVQTMVRHRKVDTIGLFVLTVVAAAAVGSLISGDPRLALARSGWITGLAALWMLATLTFKRPFTYRALEALVSGRAQLLDRLWCTTPLFRRVWRGLTWLWGLGLMVDAVLRVVFAYTLPVDTVPALDGALYAVTYVVLQVITQIVLVRTGTLRMIFGEAGDDQPDRAEARPDRAPGSGTGDTA